MCTLIVAVAAAPGRPYLVAANRDESLDRPAEGPKRWPGEDFVAPRDLLAGGTWLGLHRSGLFVAVTNRHPSERHPERASRGGLVVEALRAGTVAAAHRALADIAPERTNAFHLLYVDGQSAGLTWSDGAQLQQRWLEPGLHIVTERSLGGDDGGRTSLIHQAWPLLARDEDGLPTPAALQGLLSLRREDDPLGSVCVDVPAWRYGTRSSLVLDGRATPETSRWWWSEGQPAAGTFVERPELLAALAG